MIPPNHYPRAYFDWLEELDDVGRRGYRPVIKLKAVRTPQVIAAVNITLRPHLTKELKARTPRDSTAGGRDAASHAGFKKP